MNALPPLKKISLVLFGLALVVGATVRFMNIANTSYGLHPDEVMYGYEGFALQTTGCDTRLTGCPPLYLQGYSTAWDNRTSVLYPYMFSLWWRVFPMTTFFLRLPSVLFGLGTIVLVFFISRRLFSKLPDAAGWAALFVALSPIGISWSRIGHDPITVPFLSALIVYSILRSQTSPRWLLVASLAVAIGLYGYQPFKVVGPAVLLLSLLTIRPAWTPAFKRWAVISGVVGICVALPFTINQLINWSVVQRQFNYITIANQPEPLLQAVAQFAVLLVMWLLNPQIALLVLGPAILFALTSWRNLERRTMILLSGWALVATIPAVLTIWEQGSNEMQSRAIGLIGPVEILAGLGISCFIGRVIRQHPSIRAYAATTGIVLILVTAAATATGLINRSDPAWKSLTLKGFEKSLSFLHQPQYVDRQVTFEMYFFTQALDLAWREKIPPQLLQAQAHRLEGFLTPDDKMYAQFPGSLGRFRLCKVDDCYQLNDGRIYVVPIDQLPGLRPLYTFTVYLGDIRTDWKIVDNTTSPRLGLR